jgi:hypothetical protein
MTVSRQRYFLSALANLRDDDADQLRGFHERFADLLPAPSHLVSLYTEYAKGFSEPPSGEQINYQTWKNWHIPMRNWVRSIWRAKDERTKRWLFYPLIDSEMRVRTGRAPILSTVCFAMDWAEFPVEPPGPFEYALNYLLGPAVRSSLCRNDECPAPYFFARRRNQRYCSSDCSFHAQREHKRRWWREHGSNWRRKQSKRQRVKR